MKDKQCGKCNKIKLIKEFNLRYVNSISYQSRCKECVSKDGKKRWLKDKKKLRKQYDDWYVHNADHRKDMKLQKKYGITLIQYQSMLVSQSNLCAICRQPESSVHSSTGQVTELCVDHCHKTGKIRGLLCKACNQGIGHLKDNAEFCYAAGNYLRLDKDLLQE